MELGRPEGLPHAAVAALRAQPHATPTIDRVHLRAAVYGDGLATPRTEADALTLSFADLQRLPHHELTAVLECTGNGRSFFTTQQGQTRVRHGVDARRGRHGAVERRTPARRARLASGSPPTRCPIQATGLDDPFVSGGTDYGRVRRPFSVEKALDDALLAWGMNGEDLLPDHGYPLRLVLPGWVGIASIKWLGSLEVSTTQLYSPWNTTFYRMTGRSGPPTPRRSPSTRCAPRGSSPGTRSCRPGRSPSPAARGAAPAGSRKVSVSLDGGESWRPAVLDRAVARGPGLDAVVRAVGQPAPRPPRAARPRHGRAGAHAAVRGRRSTPRATSSTPSYATRCRSA